jgi:hypothetical protein
MALTVANDLQGQVVGFEQVAKPQDGVLVRQSADPRIKPRKISSRNSRLRVLLVESSNPLVPRLI